LAEEPERRSTLFLKGAAAMTLSEMQAFVQDLQTRPRVRLLADLPQLMALTESKFHLVERALANRMRAFSPQERAEVLAVLMQVAQGPKVEAIRDRAKRLSTDLSRIT